MTAENSATEKRGFDRRNDATTLSTDRLTRCSRPGCSHCLMCFMKSSCHRPATLADRPRNLAIGHPDDYDLAAKFETRKYGYSLSDEAYLRLHCGKG